MSTSLLDSEWPATELPEGYSEGWDERRAPSKIDRAVQRPIKIELSRLCVMGVLGRFEEEGQGDRR